MENNHYIQLNYGYLEQEDGITLLFQAAAPNNNSCDSIPNELAALLNTVANDSRFNWDTAVIRIPEEVVDEIRKEGIQTAANALRSKRREYTLQQFRPKLYMKQVTAVGRTTSGELSQCVNCSSILTSLIKTAGRMADHYASDVFILWESITDDFKRVIRNIDASENESAESCISYLFGFREMGVDSAESVLQHYNNAAGNLGHYREIWRLDVNISPNGDVHMELYEVEKDI